MVEYVFTKLLCHKQHMTQCHNLMGVKLVGIQSFFFPVIGKPTEATEPRLSYNLPSICGWTGGFIPFSWALLRSETEVASYSIWTQGELLHGGVVKAVWHCVWIHSDNSNNLINHNICVVKMEDQQYMQLPSIRKTLPWTVSDPGYDL